MNPDFVPGLVSVIVPTYNRAHIIGGSLDSVARQTYRPIQLIVVDDGSTDDTAAVVGRWQEANAGEEIEVELVRKANGGAPSARNEGLRRSQGEFIQFLDSDDIMASPKVDQQVRALQSDPAALYAWCGVKMTDSFDDWKTLEAAEASNRYRRAAPGDVPSLITRGVFRRSACLAIGPWSENLIRYQDWEYSVRYTQLDAPSLATDAQLYMLVSHPGPRIDDVNHDLRRVLRCHGEAIAAAAGAIGPHPTAAASLRLGRRAVSGLITALALGDSEAATRFMTLARQYLGRMRMLRLKSEALFALARISGPRAGSLLARRVLG